MLGNQKLTHLEMKHFQEEIKALKGNLANIKGRRRIDEKNTKKMEERMHVVKDKYEEVCAEHGIVS